jgi:hypothetical protein
LSAIARALQIVRGHVDHHPTDAQKAAGNYAKKHVRFQGLDIAIENEKGSTRRGTGPNGKPWSCTLPADYGYIKRTEGADGDHVDVYLGPHHDSPLAFVINQQDHRTGKFDEHKAMLGFRSECEAVADYVRAFSDGKGAQRIGSVEPMSIDAFKAWLRKGNTVKAIRTGDAVAHALAIARQKRKASKQSVHYSQGMKTRHCGICQHFQPPHSCEVVEGKIDPEYWCEKFKAKSAK